MREGLRKRILALALCTAWGIAAPASAQITTGAVTGKVTDAQGGVIPGAAVIIVSEAQGTKTCACRHQRRRTVRHSERHAGHVHGPGHDERLPNAVATGRQGQRRRPRRRSKRWCCRSAAPRKASP